MLRVDFSPTATRADLEDLVKGLEQAMRVLPPGGQLTLLGELAHHSRYQPRDEHGKFLPRLGTPRRLWAAERAAIQQTTYAMAFEAMVLQSQAQRSTLKARYHLKRVLRHNYETLFELGLQAAGQPEVATTPELRLLEGLIREQYGYVDGFLGDMAASAGKLDYSDRAHMHGMHARTAYWLGWIVGNRDPGRHIRWVMAPEKEHCRACAWMASHGDAGAGVWTPVKLLETGLLPQSGRLECKGYYCGCELVEEFVRGKQVLHGPRAGRPEWLEEPRRPLRWDGGTDGTQESGAGASANSGVAETPSGVDGAGEAVPGQVPGHALPDGSQVSGEAHREGVN